MSQTISAVYKNGVLILDEPLAVSNGVKVEIIVISPKNKTQETVSAKTLPIENKGGNVDESSEWSDEDLRDLSLDTFRRLEMFESEANR